MAAIGKLAFGAGVDYYTGGASAGSGGTNYYTGAVGGEPPGRWSGKGAEALGLAGDVDAQTMKNLYEKGIAPDGSTFAGRQGGTYKVPEEKIAEALAAEPYATPERERAIRREVKAAARQGNAWADFTFSLSKDMSVVHTAAAYAEEQARQSGDRESEERHRLVRETIEEAGSVGAQSAIDYLNQSAGYTRVGRGGTASMRWVDAHDWTVATFFQHTSRDGDPQLHWHNVILTATKDATGKIHKLDTELMRRNRAGASAHGARVAQEIITDKLGLEFAPRTDGNGHELVDVDDKVKELFSERRGGITKRVEKLVAEYVEVNGIQPNSLVMSRLKQEATLLTRQRKADLPRAEAIQNWDRKLRDEIGTGLARQAAVTGVQRPAPVPEAFSPHAVLSRAIARVQETMSTFSRSELTLAVEAELPSYLGVGPEGALKVIETLVDRGLEACTQINNTVNYKVPHDFRLENGDSAYQRPGGTKFVSPEHIRAEQAMARAAVRRGREAVSRLDAETWLKDNAGVGLSDTQAHALKEIMTSGAEVSVLVGPAGAGKTFVLGALVESWKQTAGGRVLGLATSEQATQVMRDEGVPSRNMAQWLVAQKRIAAGRMKPGDEELMISPLDIVVPDEASMADTDRLAEIKGYVDAAGARMLLTGDPKQLSAVGAGGVMDLVATTDGADVYELTEVRRFTDYWERTASLRLREGDLSVLDQYEMHDRVRDGGSEESALEEAARLYVGDRLDGKRAVVVTPTNAQAAKVNALVRSALVERGWVDPANEIHLERDGNACGVGDIIKCRKVTWEPGNELRNQGRYVVKEILEDGSLRVTEEGTDQERTIPAGYREEFVELGYAGTVHSAQGMTCDTGIAVVMEGQPLESVYPAMTRGRERNTALAVTVKEFEDPRSQELHEKAPLTASGVLRTILETEHEESKAALTQQAEAAAEEGSLKTVAALYEESMREHCRQRTGLWLDEMAAEGTLSPDERERLGSERGAEQLGRLLRVVEQAGHDPKAALQEAVGEAGSLKGAKMLAPTLHKRITDRYSDSLEVNPDAIAAPPASAPEEYQAHFEELTDIVRERRSELGQEIAADPPVWALESLGPVPEEVFERAAWEDRAGHIAAHREASGWTDEVAPLGPAPGISKTEARVSWAQAWEAAGRPDSTAEEHQLSEGALRNRYEAMKRVDAALPPDVFDEMQSVEEQIMAARHEAAEARNRAEAIADDLEHAREMEKAAEHESYAERWEAKKIELQAMDDARRELEQRALVTRELGQRAYRELVETRGVPVDEEPDRVTAEEWLKLEAETRVEDDEHRVVTETDLAENQLAGNEQVDEDQAVIIGEAESDLPGNVPTGEAVAEGALQTKVALEKAADEQSLESAYEAQQALLVQEHHEQVQAETAAAEQAEQEAAAY